MSSLLDRLKNTVNSTTDSEDSLILKDILLNNPEFIISKLRGNSYVLAHEEFIIYDYRNNLVTDKYNNSGEKLIFSVGDERVLVTVSSLDYFNKTTMDFDVYVNGKLLYSDEYYEESSKYGRNFYIKKHKFLSTENIVNVIVKDRLNITPKYKVIPVSTEQFDNLIVTYPKIEFGNFYDNTDYLMLFKKKNSTFYKLERNKDYYLTINGNEITLNVEFSVIDENSVFVLQNSLYYYEKENTVSNIIVNKNNIPLTFGIPDPSNSNNTLTLPLPIENTLGLEVFINGLKLIPNYDYKIYDKNGLTLQLSNVPLDDAKIRINTVPFHELNFDPVFVEYLKIPVYTDGVITEEEMFQEADSYVPVNTWYKLKLDEDLQIVPVTKVPFDINYHEMIVARTLLPKRSILNIDNIGFGIYNSKYDSKFFFRNTLLFNESLKTDIARFKNSEIYLRSVLEKNITETYEEYCNRISMYKPAVLASLGEKYSKNNLGDTSDLEIFKYSLNLTQGIEFIFDSSEYLKFENLEDKYTLKLVFNNYGTEERIDITAFAKILDTMNSSVIQHNNIRSRYINTLYMVFESEASYSIVRSPLVDIDIECENSIIFANGLETPKVKVIGYYEDFSTKDLTYDKNVTITLPEIEAGEYAPIIAVYNDGTKYIEDYFYIYAKNILDYEYLSIDGDIPIFREDNLFQNVPIINPKIISKFSGSHYLNNFSPYISNPSEVTEGQFKTYMDFNVTTVFPDVITELGQNMRINSYINSYVDRYILTDTSYINANEDIISIPSTFFKLVFNSLKAVYIDIVDKDNTSIIFGFRKYTERRFLVFNTKQYLGTNLMVNILDKDKKIIASYPARLNYTGTL